MSLKVACSDNERYAWHHKNVRQNTKAGIVTKLNLQSGKDAVTCSPALALTWRGSSHLKLLLRMGTHCSYLITVDLLQAAEEVQVMRAYQQWP